MEDLKFCSHANETAYHITKLDVDGLFWFESYFCDLQTAVHKVFYLLEINVKLEEDLSMVSIMDIIKTSNIDSEICEVG
jgi:hypothetical protein